MVDRVRTIGEHSCHCIGIEEGPLGKHNQVGGVSRSTDYGTSSGNRHGIHTYASIRRETCDGIYVYERSTGISTQPTHKMDRLTPSRYREVQEVLIWHKTSKR